MTKEYYAFTELYQVCVEVIRSISKNSINRETNILDYIRNSISKDILNSFFFVGEISQIAADKIGSKITKLKFSADSLIKNILEHSEITLDEYLKLPAYLKRADYILIKNEKNLIYFKIEGKIYQFVIKTTQDGKENFITTFHRASIKQLKKDLKRYRKL